jgi:hypothetical protein
VHAALIITGGSFTEVIAALVEDCMSLTVANIPVVAGASIRCISGTNLRDAIDDDDSQRWAALKPRMRTTRPSGATTRWSTGFGPSRGDVSVDNTMEITSTTLDAAKESLPVYSVGAIGPDEMFTGVKMDRGLDENAKRGKDGDIVRIGVLPYPHQPPSSEP